jgi:serine protease Do
MKIDRAFIGFSTAALTLAAAVATVHFVAHARDAATPSVRADNSPLNRDPATGNSYSIVVKKVAPSVVNIYSSRTIHQRYHRSPIFSDPVFNQFFGGQFPDDSQDFTRQLNWLGSGMIVTPDGYILTASHVVEGADEIKVGISSNKTEYAAQVIGTDPQTDIAVLKIDANNLSAITLGDSGQIEVGDVVLAIGNPLGLGQTVTRGIISALGRSVPMEGDNNPLRKRYQDFIQTDAAINHGNSGGALVDAQGRLIGINDAIAAGSSGIGFAVPINLARTVLEGFIANGRLVRGYLGINPQDVDENLAKSFGLLSASGALVADVGPGTPAEKAGIQPGDVITSVNGREIAGEDNLRATIAQLRPGAAAAVKVIRNGVEKNLDAVIGELPVQAAPIVAKPKPSQPTAPRRADALDGVYVQDLDPDFRRQLGAPLNVAGAVVTDVDRNSNSAEAGLRPGDVLMEINRQPVSSAEDAVRLGKSTKSEHVLIKVWRLTGSRFISVDNTRRAK